MLTEKVFIVAAFACAIAFALPPAEAHCEWNGHLVAGCVFNSTGPAVMADCTARVTTQQVAPAVVHCGVPH